MNKILVDTNILIYAIDEDSKFHQTSKNLIQNPDFDLYITSKNIAEFLTVLTRSENISETIDGAIKLLDDLIGYFTVLYPSAASTEMLIELLKKYKPRGLRVHDFEIISIGIVNGVDTIATKNISDFKGISEVQLI